MAKYLHRRNGTYYFHKRVKKSLVTNDTILIRKSLLTSCYTTAKTLSSLLNYNINRYLQMGILMTSYDIDDILYKYYSESIEEYIEAETLRHKANTFINKKGISYEGSTIKAVTKKLKKYNDIDKRRNFEDIKKIVDDEIIPRCQIDENSLSEMKEKESFYWKLFKYEIEILKADLLKAESHSSEDTLKKYKKKKPKEKIIYVQNINSSIPVIDEPKEFPKFDEMIEDIREYLKIKRDLKIKTLNTYCFSYKLIKEVFPKKEVYELTVADLEVLEDIIIHLPKNRFKMPQTKDLDIFEQTKLIKKILKDRENEVYDSKYEDIFPNKIRTINKNFERVKFFINFCANKYNFKNPCNDNKFVLESFRIKNDGSTDRLPIADNELELIFNEFDYLNSKLLFTLKNDPLKIYGIFLTLFLGMRPAEAGQLMVTDLKTTTNKDDELIYYLEISKENSSSDKRLDNVKSEKTVNTKRKLPLTRLFIDELKILEFIEYRKENKHKFIFVDEDKNKTIKSNIHNTVRRCEEHFNKKIDKLDIIDIESKSFYSLRHSFANKIKHVPESLKDKRGETLMGHSRTDTELFNRYGNKYFEPDYLYEILELVKYKGLKFDKFTEQINKLFN
ncbi:hypothetical protein [Arcobacter sp. LA11]|uniref:hypothetical protein n=1 Tax=Arcobacter sp. LA11 TaxID=1898176 RepID=UPI0011601A6E|nr:hypothetical protein [Arcobacter sp. LA11]